MMTEGVRATKEQAQILHDLTAKAVDDVMKAIDTTCDLAVDTAGDAGLFAVTLRIASFAMTGVATAMQSADKSISQDDAILLMALVVALPCKDKNMGVIRKAAAQFKLLTGRDAPRVPFLAPKDQ
jgi:hypothetical protein